MGGAFVAVVDDASAVFWNPAGLATGSYFSLVLDQNSVGTDDEAPLPRSRSGWLTAIGTPPLGISYYRTRTTRITPLSPGIPESVRASSLVTHQTGVTLVQSLVRLYAEGGWAEDMPTPEVLAENRFIALRDGMAARFIESSGTRPAADRLADLVDRCRAVARDLDATAELTALDALAADGPHLRQRAVAARLGVDGLVADLSARFANPAPAAVSV